MRASEYLIEIAAWTGSVEAILRVSTCGYNTAVNDTPANAHYPGVVLNPGSFVQQLFGSGRTLGRAEVSYGEITIANADGALDAWFDYGFDGRAITVKRLASPTAAFSSAGVVLQATVERIDTPDLILSLRLRVYDRRLAIDRPIQENLYAGTTLSGGPTAEGNLDLKDRVKPLVFGRVLNVSAVAVNPFDLIYQVNDGPVSSIAVFDGGVPLTAGTDRANLVALQGATIAPGKYDTCLALGLFRLGGAPAFAVTANVSEGAVAADRYAGAVVKRMLAKMGLATSADVDLASYAALDVIAPYEVGIFIDSEMNGLAAMGDILASVGGWIAPNASGAFSVGRFSGPQTPVAVLDEANIQSEAIGIEVPGDTDGGLPAWRLILEYARNWTVQNDGELGDCVGMTQRGFLAAEVREAKAENAATRTKHKLSPELRVTTLLVNASDAEAEAARRLALYSVRRDILSFDVDYDDATLLAPGATATVKLPGAGYALGRDMVIIGRQENFSGDSVSLTVWG